LNLLFVNSGLRYGGAETQLIAIMAELKRRGHHPSLYLLTQDAPRLQELQALGISVTVDDKRSKLDLGVLGRLRAHIQTVKPALVHGFLFDANVYARVAAAGLGVPVLCSERSDNYRLRATQALAHYPTRWLAHGVVANTHAGRRHAQRMFGLAVANTHVVWNGVRLAELDLRLAAPRRAYKHEFFADTQVKLATLVGVINTSKGYDLALQTAEHLIASDPRWRVLFVGASFGEKLAYANRTARQSVDYESVVHARYGQSPHKDKIRFTGQRSDALEIIASSDVLFSTSVHEGFPNVVLEAMVAGTPVVSTAYSDIQRILPEAWQVVGQRSPTELALAIERAFQCRPALAARQREWVERHATIERAVDTLLGIYAHYTHPQPRVQ
jgi:glycosyltransferase involved in cell wall biosynthesis